MPTQTDHKFYAAVYQLLHKDQALKAEQNAQRHSISNYADRVKDETDRAGLRACFRLTWSLHMQYMSGTGRSRCSAAVNVFFVVYICMLSYLLELSKLAENDMAISKTGEQFLITVPTIPGKRRAPGSSSP